MLKKTKLLIKKKINKGTVVYSILNRAYKIIRYLPRCLYTFIRMQSPVTKLVGPLYHLNNKVITIEITYRCNLGCVNCDQSLGIGQAPSNEEMTIEQIQKFVQESIDNHVKWNRIRVMGGEPTLHPRFFEILDVLLEYKQSYSPNTHIQISTNGYGEKVKLLLSKVPNEIMITNSAKESKIQLHYPFNMAPKDSILYKYADYANGCWICSLGGMALTPYGYYPCGPSGGIDRIFGFDKGRKTLPSPDDPMLDDLRFFCQFCGHFKCASFTYKALMSLTWKRGYENYKRKRTRLSLY